MTPAQGATLLAIATLAALPLSGCGDNQTVPDPHDPYGEGDAGALACVPNLDGKIDAAELRAAFNVPVSYLVSPKGEKRTVDVAGKGDGMGGLIWDYSPDIASDQKATLSAHEVIGSWYASSFPEGQFASPIDAGGTIDGVYKADAQAISLLGVASVTENPKAGKTLLVYDTPIAIYRFPLVPGAKWVSKGTIKDGVVSGLPYAGSDTYEVEDDATGRLDLHDFTFTQVHRIRTKVTLSPAVGASTFQRQVGFVTECFGEVTRATSLNDEKANDFTTASEVRRLGQ
jgi:hypothetical protein